MKKFCSGEIVPRWSLSSEGSVDVKSRELLQASPLQNRPPSSTPYAQLEDLRSSLQEANAA